MTFMIESQNLTKFYDDFLAVDGVNLNVPSGSVLALLGPNGAGKTTTVRMLTSILAPSSGWAKIAGYDVSQQPEQVRAHVGVLTEQHGLYERMKAIEYLDFFGQVYHMPLEVRRKRSFDLMERFGLSFALKKTLGEYSKGMKQKLALVRAMLHDPDVRILIYCNNNFSNNAQPVILKRVELALNIQTFINLYGYGYRNVYELGDVVDFNDPAVGWVRS